MTAEPSAHGKDAEPSARMWSLVEAGLAVSKELHLDAVLRRIVETACDVIGTRYGALGVINEDRTGLSNFVFHGISDEERERIGELPIGKGLLGALIDDPRPIRLQDLSGDPRGVGFPPNHPPMHTFLGVPVTSKGKVFGNLYLTEKLDAGPFTDEDERFATVLAWQAGVAVDNARLYEHSTRKEFIATKRLRELEIVQEVGGALLGELDPARVLRVIAHHARELVNAHTSFIALYDAGHGELRVRVAAGDRAGAVEGITLPLEGSFSGDAMRNIKPILVDDALADPRGDTQLAEALGGRSVMFAPLVERGSGIGALAVVHREAGHFDDEDLFVVRRFADLASLALQNARLAAAERERARFEAELAAARVRDEMRGQMLRAVLQAQEEERRRIARELHDSFGQALASILLGLKVAGQEKTLPEALAHLSDLREVAAAAAREVRRIAVELRPTTLDDLGLAVALERLTQDVADRTGVEIASFIELGSLGSRLDPDVETVVYRVAQEAITNAIKSAEPSLISVSLRESNGGVNLTVTDDGRGFDPLRVSEGLGLLGMHERAGLVGGRVDIASAPRKGTKVELVVPHARRSGQGD